MDNFKHHLTDIKEIIRKKQNLIIRIYGHSASGKSTFCQMLINELDNKTVNLLETDPYIISSDLRS